VDVLRIGRSQDPSVLLPYTDNTLVGSNIRAQIFNSLTTRDQDETVLPDLAYYIPTLENGGAYYVGTGDDKRLVLKYKLKHGIKWADGQEFDSNDVIFTYKLILDPDFPATSRQTYQKFQSIDNPDKYTIIINYLTWKEAEALIKRDPDTYAHMQGYVDKKIPVTDTLYNEVIGYILPEHILGKIAPQNIESSEYARLPWGTGPYKPTKFEKTTTIEMEANANYNVNLNVPFTKKLSLPYFRDNKQLPVGMDTGTIDVAMSSGLDNDFLPALQAVADKGKVVLSTKASNTYEHIDFHNQKEPFNDIRVRQAVAYALDRDAINKALFAGRVTFINTWLSPNNWASAENPKNTAKFGSITSQLVKYNYNPDKAKALLDEAGWKVGADGIREKNGKKLKINWLTTNRAYRVLMAQVQQQYMKAIGIESTPDVRPAGEVFADPPEGPLYSGSYGDFGVVEFAWAGTDEPGGTGLYDSTQIPSEANGFSGTNDLFWSNAASDKLLRDAESFIGKPDERIKAYLEQQVIFSKELPSIPLFLLTTISMYDKKLQNYQITSQGVNLNINEWYLSK
jgi:peptide/nickel transport system substrate-binding protein